MFAQQFRIFLDVVQKYVNENINIFVNRYINCKSTLYTFEFKLRVFPKIKREVGKWSEGPKKRSIFRALCHGWAHLIRGVCTFFVQTQPYRPEVVNSQI